MSTEEIRKAAFLEAAALVRTLDDYESSGYYAHQICVQLAGEDETEEDEGVESREPFTEDAWESAPIGSSHVVDAQTGQEWIEPPAPPVSVEEFLRPVREQEGTER